MINFLLGFVCGSCVVLTAWLIVDAEPDWQTRAGHVTRSSNARSRFPGTVTLPRDDLERLTSSATAMVAARQVLSADERRQFGELIVTADDNVEHRVDVHLAMTELAEAVVRTRRLLGWRS